MTEREELRAYLWLCACADLENRERAALLRAAESPASVLRDLERIAPKALKRDISFLGNRSERENAAENFLSGLERKRYFAVTPFDDDYPEELRQIPDPPFALFGAGRRELLRAKKFCIVGSRITPPYAEKLGRKISEELSPLMTVVTGMAEGGDSAAIMGALPHGNLICVLPNGLDVCYPAANASLKERVAERGLLLSELPPAEPLRKYYFHARNRILAGLSAGTLVISAGARSGALITAGYAADYGRDVFAFPYNVGVSQGVGCNELIKKGAFLCTESGDIAGVYGLKTAKKAEDALSFEEERVYSVLSREGELHVAAIAERAERKIFEVSAVLASLEIKGLVVKTGGNKYSVV